VAADVAVADTHHARVQQGGSSFALIGGRRDVYRLVGQQVQSRRQHQFIAE
jgi:hypothetical protein